MALTSTIARPVQTSHQPIAPETAETPLPAIATEQRTMQDVFTELMPADWHLAADSKLYTPVPMFTDPAHVPEGFANARTSLNWTEQMTLEERTETREDTEHTVLWIKAFITGACYREVIESERTAELDDIRRTLCVRMIGAIERRLHS